MLTGNHPIICYFGYESIACFPRLNITKIDRRIHFHGNILWDVHFVFLFFIFCTSCNQD